MENVTKPLYLDHLEKEMTIMGILSAFCVGATGLIIKESKLLSLCDPRPPGYYCIILGSALMIAAAGFFYLQRASLAWHYGQISLWATDSDSASQTLNEIISNSDTWSGWIPYQVGLFLTIGSFLAYAGIFLDHWQLWYVIIVLFLVTTVSAYTAVVRIRRDKADTTPKPKRKSTRRLRSKPNDASR